MINVVLASRPFFIACLASILTLLALWVRSKNTKNNEIQKVTETVSASPTFSGVNRKLLFDSNRSGTFGVYVLDLVTQKITSLYDSELHDLCPKQSPDGQWIAFIRTNSLERYKPAELWRMRWDGSEAKLVAKNAECPSFHPNSNHIRFARRGWSVVQIDPSNKHEKVIVNSKSVCKDTKDGKIHLVESSRFDPLKLLLVSRCRKSWSIASIDLSLLKTGQGVKHLSAGCQPSWISPYGDNREHMMWVTNRNAKERTAVVAWDPETQSSRIVHDDDAPWGHEYFPSMTADGEYLFYSACGPDGHDHIHTPYQLFVKRMKDNHVFQLTNDGHNNRVAQEYRVP